MLLKSRLIVTAALTAVVAVPIVAQDRNRPSRECMREVVKLCGRDRSEIRECLREKLDELSSGCAAEAKERMERRQRRPGVDRSAAISTMAVTRTVFFGSDSRQQIDVYEPADAVDELPLILFVHGGGWVMGDHKRVQGKPTHFTGNGYYFGSTGYRLVPNVTVEEQARDIGAAVQALRGQAGAIGFDRDRIVLMGHSAGAHLAALVATDPQYAGDAFDAIKGVVLLDGAGYDVADSVKNAERMAKGMYAKAFGDDPARHTALSPITHTGGLDAPNWLALYVAERARSKTQSLMLADKLTRAGVAASAIAINGTDHGRMNRELGLSKGAEQTQAVDAFLRQLFD